MAVVVTVLSVLTIARADGPPATATATGAPVVVQTETVHHAPVDDVFRACELDFSLYGGWVDKHDSKVAPGIGLTYFFTRNFGIGGTVDMENYDGSFVDNAAAEGYLRFPLCSHFAAYALGGGGYNWESEETFEYAGGGLEYRFNRAMGIFGDVRWQFNNDTDDGIGVRVGLRWAF